MKIKPAFTIGHAPTHNAPVIPVTPAKGTDLSLFLKNLTAMHEFYAKVPRDGLHLEHTEQMALCLRWTARAVELAIAGKVWEPPYQT